MRDPFRIVVRAGLFLFGCIFAACDSSETDGAKAAQKKPSGVESHVVVEIVSPVLRNIQRTGRGQGALFAKESIILSNKREGYVMAVNVDFGDKVRKGQILAEMEQEELGLEVDVQDSALKQAQANFVRARAEFARAQQLAEERLIPRQRLDTKKADYMVAEAQVLTAEKFLALARKRLRDARIVSPVDGIVQERFTNPGEFKRAASQLLELVVVNPLKLRAPVPERFAAAAKIGMPLRVEVEALPGQIFEGTLTRTAARVNHKTRSLLIEAEIDNEEEALRPGYFARITGVLGNEEALFVPVVALMRFAGVERVFTVEGSVVHSREVVSGEEDGEWIEITQGLTPAEKVVVTAVSRLADGMTVQLKTTP